MRWDIDKFFIITKVVDIKKVYPEKVVLLDWMWYLNRAKRRESNKGKKRRIQRIINELEYLRNSL